MKKALALLTIVLSSLSAVAEISAQDGLTSDFHRVESYVQRYEFLRAFRLESSHFPLTDMSAECRPVINRFINRNEFGGYDVFSASLTAGESQVVFATLDVLAGNRPDTYNYLAFQVDQASGGVMSFRKTSVRVTEADQNAGTLLAPHMVTSYQRQVLSDVVCLLQR